MVMISLRLDFRSEVSATGGTFTILLFQLGVEVLRCVSGLS